MNPKLNALLAKVAAVMHNDHDNISMPQQLSDNSNYCDSKILTNPLALYSRGLSSDKLQNRVHVGIDIGTAYTVLIVLDERMQPMTGEYRFAQFVRDGLVVDSQKAISMVQKLKHIAENRLGFKLSSAATAYPPGVLLTEIKAKQYVVNCAGFECDQSINEPTAANLVLQIKNGAIVDIGGGTTGIAVVNDGHVVYTADEPTGGTHFSLVIAGALNIEFEKAELLKKDPKQHSKIYPLVKPVMEKIGTIVANHLLDQDVSTIYLVGGTSCFIGIGKVIQKVTGITTIIPAYPLFITPLGVAMFNANNDKASY